jgi:hypothetical protein
MAVADITNPKVMQDYTTLLASIRDLFISQAALHDATGIVGLTAGAIRYSGTNTRFEKFDGTTWNALTVSISGNSANVTGIVAGANGGTGVNNSGKTITLGGNLTLSGAFNSTFTMTGATTVTFPASGTLLSTAAAVTVAQGGTGATTAVAGLANLGGMPSSVFTPGALAEVGRYLDFHGTSNANDHDIRFDAGPTPGSTGMGTGTWTCASMSFAMLSGGYSQLYAGGYTAYGAGGSNANLYVGASYSGLYLYTPGGIKQIRVGGSNNLEFVNSTNTALCAYLTDTGQFVANQITQTSDERKKENWKPLTDAQLDALADMKRAGTFEWVDGSGPSVGGSAQEIRVIVPEAVHEDEQGNLSVNYGGLCFAMQQATLRRLWGTK